MRCAASISELRLVTVAADDEALRWARVLALRAGAEVVASLDARDGRGLAERAGVLRSREARAVLVVARRAQAQAVADVVEAARVARSGVETAALVLCAADAGAASAVQDAAAGVVPLLRAPYPAIDDGAAAVAALRELRRATIQAQDSPPVPLAIETLEDRVRAFRAETVLACEVDEDAARVAVGSLDTAIGVEIPAVGVGGGADALIRRVGARSVRRWLTTEPLPDGAALRDRVANLSRFGTDGEDDGRGLLRQALLREALGAIARAAARELVAPALSRPRRVALYGAFDWLPARDAVAIFLDAVQPFGAFVVTGGDRILAIVVADPPRRSTLELRVTDARGERVERIAAGSLAVLPVEGRVAVRSGRRVLVEGDAGDLGLVVDARQRPLALPERDNERLPLLAAWSQAFRAG